MMGKTTRRISWKSGTDFLSRAAIVLLMCILSPLTISSVTTLANLTLYGPFGDWTEFVTENIALNLVLTAAAIGALLGMKALLERVGGVKLSAGMLALWAGAALAWVLAIQLISESDFGCVVDSAEKFAEGGYDLLRWGYFRGSSYQLGICLLIESIVRLVPMLDVDVVMQCINVFLGVGFMGLMAAFAQEVLGVRCWVSVLLYVLYLPAFFYTHYVYGTLFMIFFGALGCWCFARYLRVQRVSLLAVMMVSLALGYVLKPNGIVLSIALLICAVLHAMESGDVKPVFFAAGAFVLGYAFNRLSIYQYELRAGFPLDENQSLLTWLVMAMTPAEGVTPGWYTGYAGMFYDLYLPKEEQNAIVMADLSARLAQIAADPGAALLFFKEKILSQWVEPTFSVMNYGLYCEYQGNYNGLAILVFREGLINDLIRGYMNVYQQALYVLDCIGTGSLFVRRKNAAAMVLPVAVIGGFLFHTLMEAKSQYIYPYFIYMIPLCALGLEQLYSLIGRKALQR